MTATKPPLVLLHGWAIGSRIWSPLLEQLRQKFDVQTLDMPGYGPSATELLPADNTGEAALVEHAQWLLDAMPPRAIVVGWSLGGTIALTAARQAPDRFQCIQLVSTTPRFLRGADWECGVELAPFTKLGELFERNFEKGLLRFLLLQLSGGPKAAAGSSVKATARALMQELLFETRPTTEALHCGLQMLASADLRATLKQVDVPIQVIAGRGDEVVSHAASQVLANELPNAEFVSLEAGHLPFLDQTDQFVRSLLALAEACQ